MIKFLKQKSKNETYPAKLKRSRGFTLVETLIAISIFSVSVVAMMSILGTGIYDTNYAKKKMAASYLAQEGIEYIRNVRDNDVLYTSATGNNWSTFITFMSSSPSYPSPDPNFTRTIQMTIINPNEVKVSSTVSWIKGVGPTITFSENLFNWVE